MPPKHVVIGISHAHSLLVKNYSLFNFICRDAAMMSMRRAIAGKRPEEIRNMSKTDVLHPISQEDFESALAKISRSVGKTDIDKYEKWREEFGAQ